MSAKDHSGLPPLRDIIAEFGLHTKKSFGQHFLLDSNLTDRIARNADVEGRTVVEVGPGPGGLTRSLLSRGVKHLIAIEKDTDCVAALQHLKEHYPDQLTIMEADALEVTLGDLGVGPVSIVSNLPYNVSTPLLLHWLHLLENVESLTLMFQKEVADRLTAVASTKAYGRLSVMTQWLCEARHLFNVDKRAFVPPPKVMSSVISLAPHPAPLADARWEAMEEVTATAFNQRRKMLRSSLKKYKLEFEALGIDPQLRAENLSVKQFGTLARAIER